MQLSYDKIRYIVWAILFTIISGLGVWMILNKINAPKNTYGINGVFDYSDVDFNRGDILALNGDAFFFWDTLSVPSFKEAKNNTKTISIPGTWNDFQHNNSSVGSKGYATYMFRILVPKDGLYGLKVKEFETAYAIYINGEYAGGAGEVGTSKKQMTPSWKRQQHYFYSIDKTIDIVIQVSNFHHRKGGCSETIYFGKADYLITLKNNKLSIEFFVFGILFILFIYHVILSLYRRKDPSIIYFFLITFLMMLRLGTTGEKVLIDRIPFMSWDFAIRMEYLSMYSIAAFITLFYYSLIPKEVSKLFLRFILAISGLFTLSVLVLSPMLFSYTPVFFQYFIGAAAAYLLFATIRAVIRNREYALPLFSGFYFFLFFFINDLLYFNKAIDSYFLLPAGLLFLTVSQAIVISKRASIAFTNTEELSKELSFANTNLEQKVVERTKLINDQKTEIEVQKQNIEQKAKELEKKNNKLQALAKFKSNMTNMMVHDLKTPLNNIIGYTEIAELKDDNSAIITVSAWSMHNLINNILDVEKYRDVGIKLNKKATPIHTCADKAFELTQHMIFEKNISFENRLPEDLELDIDAEIIIRVFVNIFSNSSKYGNLDGSIKVWHSYQTPDNKIMPTIYVYNSGEPIPAEKIESIFNKYEQLDHSTRKHSFTTGIGLTYCRLAINAHKGKVGAISGENEGVTFWFSLPQD